MRHLFRNGASDLDRLRLVLRALPDEELVCLLEQLRGHGRNDYPVRPMWNAFIAGIVFQHPSAAALVRELWRNGELRDLCGFNPHGKTVNAPSADAMERFCKLIVEHSEQLLKIFHRLVDELKRALPNLGAKTAVDSKAIQSFGNPVRDNEKLAEPDGRRDTDANWGVKTYKGVRKDGSNWEKIVKWFGYKLHLLVDSVYELPLAFELDVASSSDSKNMTPLVDNLREHHRALCDDISELAADKGYDSADNNICLYDEYSIKPIIDKRQMWKTKKFENLFPERYDVFSYDESGKVYCSCPSERRGEDELREMAFVGFEKERKTLKYRCPAAVFRASQRPSVYEGAAPVSQWCRGLRL